MKHKIQPKFKTIKNTTLLGMSKQMSLLKDETASLFREFMPRKKEIKNLKNSDVFDLQVYHKNHFNNFNPATVFTKYVLVECNSINDIPNGMETFELIAGDYAVFEYKGLSSDTSIYEYIYANWIPNSKYELDDRPHFGVLTEKTKLNDPNSEEDIWIPIKSKA